MLYAQDKIIQAEKAFFMGTKGNARILGIDSGEIVKGKKAEVLKIDFSCLPKTSKDVLNSLIFKKNYKRELIIF